MKWRQPRANVMPSIDSVIETHQYHSLLQENAFRVAEILPGSGKDQIRCRLHDVKLGDYPQYEAISTLWGSPLDRAKIRCDGQTLHITRSVYTALLHFRNEDKSRMIWADSLCINQAHETERSSQLEILPQIFKRAQKVLIWLGSDNERDDGALAVSLIKNASDVLAKQFNLNMSAHACDDTETHYEVLLKSRSEVPAPATTGLGSDSTLKSVLWFYSQDNFNQLWAIQEITANKQTEVCVGKSSIAWNSIDLVACYLLLEESFSLHHDFSKANCWHVAMMAEIDRSRTNWLNTLYLASNYGYMDERDVVYGMRALMASSKSTKSIEPDYDLTVSEVYRDAVEAALLNFDNLDVLCYVNSHERPSWIPRWDVPMQFRNPFRFGRRPAWSPAANKAAEWSIDKSANTLTISGFIAGEIELVEPYNQGWFAGSSLESEASRAELQKPWIKILQTLAKTHERLPIARLTLTALAVSLSFGVDYNLESANDDLFLLRLVAYLVLLFKDSEASLDQFIGSELIEDSIKADGKAFGKPVWKCEYSESSIFITKDKLIGCTIAAIQPGDLVFVPYGLSFPLVLRPPRTVDGQVHHNIRGYSYCHGVMHGELASSQKLQVTIG